MKKKSPKDNENPRTRRQIEVLKKYYQIDEENKIIYLPMHLAHAKEIINTDVGDFNHPHGSNEFIKRVYRVAENFPVEYQVDFSLTISDFDGYSPNQVVEAIRDCLEISQYRSFRVSNRSTVVAAILALLGIMALLAMKLFDRYNGTDSYLVYDVINHILSCLASVLVWEAFSILLIYPMLSTNQGRSILSSFSLYSFYDKDHNLIEKYTQKEMTKGWAEETKTSRINRNLGLFSGVAFFAIALVSITNAITTAVESSAQGTNLIVVSVDAATTIAHSLLGIVAGVSAISSYNHKGPLKNATRGLSFAVLLFAALMVILHIVYYAVYHQAINSANLFSIILTGIVGILYFVGNSGIRYRALIKGKKKTKDEKGN